MTLRPQHLFVDPDISFKAFLIEITKFFYGTMRVMPLIETPDHIFIYNQAMYIFSQNLGQAYAKRKGRYTKVAPPYGPGPLEGEDFAILELECDFWLSEHSDYSRETASNRFVIPDEFIMITDSILGEINKVSRRYTFEEMEPAQIWVKRPSSLLAKAYQTRPLPDDDWFAAHRKYNFEITKELIAACWRHIAISKPIRLHGLATRLLVEMRKYLDAHDTSKDKPGEDMLYQIARRIVRQYENEDTTSSVLVGSKSSHSI